MKPQIEITVDQIAEQTGADRASVKKWLKAEGFEPIAQKAFGSRKFNYYGVNALEYIKSRVKSRKAPAEGGSMVDPETGLPWPIANEKEKTLEKRRENEIAEKVAKEEWMAVATHHEILSSIVSKIEQLPGKWKSELGLSDSQTLAIRRGLDEARSEAAAEVEKATC